ncbi:MAG: SLBB domain-containing protein [Gemmatimonadetes bacterium]|nr:SLBB domain-containing protein [Gemmatimonadota bacterium]
MSRLHRLFRHLPLGLSLVLLSATPLLAQVPTGGLPSPDQARQLLQTRPDLVRQLRERIGTSGLTPEQIRARLRAAGYPEDLLDPYLAGADTTRKLTPGTDILEASRVLGLVSAEDAESLLVLTDSALKLADSLRADSLSDTTSTLQVFGLSLFRRSLTVFSPELSGPVDANYRLGPGDGLVLILTGDVELAHELVVTREGFIAIPQVGQLYVSNLTLGQLEDLLYARLGRVYSGVRRGAGATTRFNVTVARLRTVQVFVTGDVARPGSYQVSAAGTALSALYAAGGPTENGSFRHVEIRRGGRLLDSLDLYDYLLRGDNSRDARLENGDVIFVPVRGTQVKVTGAIIRPAIYELRAEESLRDLLQSAGGFEAVALRRRVQVDRILPPAQRAAGGRDRVVLEIGAEQFEDGRGPAFAMAPGDSVTVFEVAERRRNLVMVNGNVWTPGAIGLSPGMRLSEAIRLAGGPKPDVYLAQIGISRLQPDSTRLQLRSAFRDSTGAVTDDLPLQEDDAITVFSRSSFRPLRYVAVTGAVRRPGRVPYREGLTLRDALLEVEGLTEDALLTEAEVARLPDAALRATGHVAATFRVPLDSTYVFDRGPAGRYLGPRASGPRRRRRRRGAAALRQRAHLPPARLGAAADRLAHRAGALPRPLRAHHPHRPPARPDQPRRRPHQGSLSGRHPVLPHLRSRRPHRRGPAPRHRQPALPRQPDPLRGRLHHHPRVRPGGVRARLGERPHRGHVRRGPGPGLLHQRGGRLLPHRGPQPVLRDAAQRQGGERKEAVVVAPGRRAGAPGGWVDLCAGAGSQRQEGLAGLRGVGGPDPGEPHDRHRGGAADQVGRGLTPRRGAASRCRGSGSPAAPASRRAKARSRAPAA